MRDSRSPRAHRRVGQIFAVQDPVFHLRLLGAQAIEGPKGYADGQVMRAQAFSLLARLAVGGSSGVPRDRIIAMFWPDSSPESGRHALSNLLYAARTELDKSAIQNLGDSVRLRPDAWRVDHWEFAAGIAEGDYRRAAMAYRGPFLDGIRTRVAPVERWIDGERQRLELDYLLALESLGHDAAGRNDTREAVRWWRRAVAADPLHSGRTIQLMVWLARSGDLAAALRESRRHAELRRSELDLQPEPAVAAVEESIKRGEIPPIGLGPSVA